MNHWSEPIQKAIEWSSRLDLILLAIGAIAFLFTAINIWSKLHVEKVKEAQLRPAILSLLDPQGSSPSTVFQLSQELSSHYSWFKVVQGLRELEEEGRIQIDPPRAYSTGTNVHLIVERKSRKE